MKKPKKLTLAQRIEALEAIVEEQGEMLSTVYQQMVSDRASIDTQIKELARRVTQIQQGFPALCSQVDGHSQKLHELSRAQSWDDQANRRALAALERKIQDLECRQPYPFSTSPPSPMMGTYRVGAPHDKPQ